MQWCLPLDVVELGGIEVRWVLDTPLHPRSACKDKHGVSLTVLLRAVEAMHVHWLSAHECTGCRCSVMHSPVAPPSLLSHRLGVSFLTGLARSFPKENHVQVTLFMHSLMAGGNQVAFTNQECLLVCIACLSSCSTQVLLELSAGAWLGTSCIYLAQYWLYQQEAQQQGLLSEATAESTRPLMCQSMQNSSRVCV